MLGATERWPVRRLVPLALQAGRRGEARRALLSLARAKWPTGILADEVVAVIRMIGLDAIGTALVELGLTADAVPLLRDAQALSARADLTLPPSLFPGLPEIPQQVEEHLNAALDGMSTSDLAAVAGQAIARAGEEQAGQVIDLTTLVHPRNLDQATVRSLFADSLAACDGGALAALEQPLEALRRAHPDDLSVAISAALLALAANDPGRVQSALEQLAALVEKTPIERLADGVRANAREREEAARQIPLWLVARACRKQANASAKTQAYADRFAARAVEAARRQEDRVWLLAMMREQGQLAFERNDRAGAAAVWSRMLDLVVTPPQVRARRPALNPGARAGTRPAAKSMPAREKTAAPAEP